MKMKRSKNWLWGIFLLLAAAFIVANQLGWLVQFSFGTIIAAVIAAGLLISCITHKTITTLPFVLAMVYIVLRNQEIVPYVALWAVLVVAALVSAGIGLLFPQKPPRGKVVVGSFFGDDLSWDDESKKTHVDVGGMDNNPTISVTFGSVSRYLHADRLETVQLSCNFGGMEIYFDQTQLGPSGATVHLDCKFGGIDLFVPRHWRVSFEQINCVFGGADINDRLSVPSEDAPMLTITGNVMFGGVDIQHI